MADKAVIDTNTFVSAVLSASSTPARAIEKAFYSGDVLRSVDTWQELENVFLREKFDKYQTKEFRLHYLSYLMLALEPVSVHSSIRVCRDPKDNKFLELAVDGGADLIITGDRDLLVLHPFRGITILTPSAYLER